MADKGFGAKEFNIISAGTPTISSPLNLNLSANNVAISTNLSIGGKVTSTITFSGSNYLNFDKQSVKIGYEAGLESTYENTYNTFIGHHAGRSAEQGECNVAIGYSAGYNNTTGDNNIFLGSSGYNNTTGSDNVFLGKYAGKFNTSGTANVYIGLEAGRNSSLGGTFTNSRNVFIGCQTGKYAKDTLDSVMIGTRAGFAHTGGLYNNFIGFEAGCGLYGASSAIPSSIFSNIIGYQAGRCASNVDNVNMLGRQAGMCIKNQIGNNFIGWGAGCGTGGFTNNVDHNNAIGTYAAANIVVGCCNNSIGYLASFNLSQGCHNNHIGTRAGQEDDIGCYNNYMGFYAGFNACGLDNVYVGSLAGGGAVNTACVANYNNESIFIGKHAGRYAGVNVVNNPYTQDAGQYNIMLGSYAGSVSYGGQDNIFIGRKAGCQVNLLNSGTGANFNVAIGNEAASCARCMVQGIAIGPSAGKYSGIYGNGTANIYIGSDAGTRHFNGNNLIVIGASAGQCAWRNSTNYSNETILIGNSAGQNHGGSCNVAIGLAAAQGNNSNTNFSRFNTIVGAYSGRCLNSGNNNTLIGSCAALQITTGGGNTVIGKAAAYALTSSGGNVIIGENAASIGLQAGGNVNVIIGNNAGMNVNTNLNTFIGYNAGCLYTTGCQNLAIGAFAATDPGSSITVSGIQPRCNQIMIGSTYEAGGNGPFNNSTYNKDGVALIGNSNTTQFGVKLRTLSTTTNSLVLRINCTFLPVSGGPDPWEVYAYSSSKKGKEDITPFLSGMEELLKLKPVTWLPKLPDDTDITPETDDRVRDIGFIAEDVYESNLKYFAVLDGNNEPGGVNYDKIPILTVNAIKELYEDHKLLKAKVEELENLIKNND